MVKKSNLLKYTLVVFIILSVIGIQGCKKIRFSRNKTIILVNDKLIDELDNQVSSIFISNENEDSLINLTHIFNNGIDWDKRRIELHWTEIMKVIDPTKPVKFSVVPGHFSYLNSPTGETSSYSANPVTFKMTVKIKPKKVYEMNFIKNTFEKIKLDDASASDNILGKWIRTTGGCTNVDGNKESYTLNGSGTGGSGSSFQPDCNSTCTGNGITFSFNWTKTSTMLTFTYTAVSSYCGTPGVVPSQPDNVPYTFSGNTLKLNGVDFHK